MSQIITHIMVAFIILAGVIGVWFQWAYPSLNARIFGWPNRIGESVWAGFMSMIIIGAVMAFTWHVLRFAGVSLE